MGTLGDIKHLRLALNVASENHRNVQMAVLKGLEQFLEANCDPACVRHFNTYGALAGNRSQDSHPLAADAHADVRLKVENLADKDSRSKCVFIQSDRGSLDDICKFDFHLEVMHDRSNQLACPLLFRSYRITGLGEILQQVRRWRIIALSLPFHYCALAGIVACKTTHAHFELNLAGTVIILIEDILFHRLTLFLMMDRSSLLHSRLRWLNPDFRRGRFGCRFFKYRFSFCFQRAFMWLA